MITLSKYHIGLVSQDPLTRKIVPHFMGILGQKNVSMYSTLADAARLMRKQDGHKILLCDGEESIAESRSYQLNLKHIYIYVMISKEGNHSCSVEACIDALQGIYGYLHDRPSLTDAQATPPSLVEDTIDEASYIYQFSNPPRDLLTIYQIHKPLTMRGVVSVLRATLPEQYIITNKVNEINYDMLENNLRSRVKSYAKEMGIPT